MSTIQSARWCCWRWKRRCVYFVSAGSVAGVSGRQLHRTELQYGYLKVLVGNAGGADLFPLVRSIRFARVSTPRAKFTSGCFWYRDVGSCFWRGGVFFPEVLPGNNASLIGLVHPDLWAWWRGAAAYGWLIQLPFMQEKVYVLGTGERAQRLVLGPAAAKELGVDVIGWSGNVEGALTRESAAAHLMELAEAHRVHRVIVAMPDRRGTFPVQELLAVATEWRDASKRRRRGWKRSRDGLKLNIYIRAG